MTPEEEFEEWWGKDAQGAAWYWSKKACSREAYLEAHSRQEKRIQELRNAIEELIANNHVKPWIQDILQKLLEEKDK